MKLKLTAIAGLICLSAFANAATVQINNVAAGPGDYLYASSLNVPLLTGTASLGTFTTGFDVTGNQSDLAALLGAFQSLTSFAIGTAEGSLGAGPAPGYAEGPVVNIGSITGSNALLGVTLYQLVVDGATYALLDMGALRDDVPVPNDYTSNPAAATALLVGSFSTVNITDGSNPAGDGTYNTLVLVPEPSAALLGALGVLGLLRRRRI